MMEGGPQGDPLILLVESLISGGRGMATLPDGRKAFIQGAFVGDQVLVHGFREQKSFVEVSEYELLSGSPMRVKPSCPLAAECGGCDWMQLGREAQHGEKLSIVKQALRRTGGIDLDELRIEARFHPSPEPFGYRSRVRLQVRAGKMGFFRPGTHDLLEVESCPVTSSLLAKSLELVRAAMQESPQALDWVQGIEVRAIGAGRSPHPTTCSAHFVLSKKPMTAPSGKAASLRRLRESTQQLAGRIRVRISKESVKPQRFEPMDGVFAYAPVGSFTQVNEAVNRLLVERIVNLAESVGARRFLDLYCGCGNFSLPLSAQGLSGVGVETNEEAILSARAAADEQGLNVEYLASPSEVEARRFALEGHDFDFLVADPPRAGAKELVPELLRLKIPQLAMISCDPVTLARDLKQLLLGGYQLVALEVFDMFPQTHHVESLAVLRLT